MPKIAPYFLLAAVAVMPTLSAADPMTGTWNMNVEKSKFSPGPAPKSAIQVYTEEGEWLVVKAESVNAAGQTTTNINRYKRDGKEYPWRIGATGTGTITARKIDDYHFESVLKDDAGGTITILTELAKDGKSRTQTYTGVNARGQQVNSVVVYEKQ